jgi:hypothetical protein
LGTIWEELNTKKISDSPSETIQNQSDPVHIEASNVGVLSSIDLINKATMRADAGIIPDSIEFKVANFDDNQTQTVLEPKKGEIWIVFCPIAKVITGGTTGSVGYQLWIEDTVTGYDYRVYYYASTSSSPIPVEDAGNYKSQLFQLGYGQRLNAEISDFSATKISWGVLAGRVR